MAASAAVSRTGGTLVRTATDSRSECHDYLLASFVPTSSRSVLVAEHELTEPIATIFSRTGPSCTSTLPIREKIL
jgi:hypothetical protein